MIAFELLNEPRAAADTFTMNDIYQRLIGTLREVAPHATLFVGPGDWNNAAELPWLRLPPDDSNIVVSIHNYDPFLFTQQGSEWNHPMTSTTCDWQTHGQRITDVRFMSASGDAS